MLFGTLHQETRNFYHLFKDKSEEGLLFHVFSRLAVKYRGDVLASTQLHGAYYRRLSEINFTKIGRAYKDCESAILNHMTETTLSQKMFIGLFNGLCQNEFMLALAEFNDHDVELLQSEDLDWYIFAAEHIAFPDQWRVLSALWGLKVKN